MNKRFKQIMMLVFVVALILPQFGIAQKTSAAGNSGGGGSVNLGENYVLKVETTGGKQWDGAQIDTSGWNLVDGATYTFSFDLYTPDQDVDGILLQTNKSYSGIKDTGALSAASPAWTSYTGELTYSSDDDSGAQIQFVKKSGATAAKNITYYIDNFVVEDTTSNEIVYTADFNDQTVGGFSQSGTAILSAVVPDYFLKIQTTGGKQWDGVQIDTSGWNLVDGVTYTFSFDLYNPDQDVDGILLQTNKSYSGIKDTGALSTASPAWTSYTGELTYSSDDDSGAQIQFVKKSGATAAKNITYYIDNFVVKDATSGEVVYTADFDDQTVGGFSQSGTATLTNVLNIGTSTTSTEPPVSDKPVVAYDLQEDTELADLVSGGGSTYLQRAGNLTINAVSNTNGTVSLVLSNRTLNYEGVDVKASAIGLAADSDYTVELTGHIPDTAAIPKDAQIVLSTAGGSYPTLAQVDAAGTFKLSYSGTAAADSGETSGLRIQADPELSQFVIDTLVVTVTGGIAMPPKSLSNVPGVHVALTSNGDSWSGANIILGTDSSEWPYSTGDVVAFEPVEDAKYHLTFNATSTGTTGYRVRWITGNENGGYTAGDTAVVTADANRTYEVGVVANGLPASFAGSGIVKAQEIDYDVDFIMSGSEIAQGLIGNIAIRGTAGSNDFLLNSIKITDESGNVLINWIGSSSTFVPDDYTWPEAKWNLTLPSLKDAYSEYFQIGNIMEPGQTTDETLTAMYGKQYNAVTAENAMKPENILRNMSSASDLSDSNKYNFASSDQIVQWAEDNDQSIHGHTLVWHSQTPAFINTGASGAREIAQANMETFITNVITHFDSPNFISWDVVNEAFDDDTAKFNGSDWRTGLRTSSPWYIAYAKDADPDKGESGADYMYDAFVFAHLAQAKIGSTAVLYYNDYNETYKYEQIAQMVEDLNAQWEQDSRYDDRNLIEGIGLQSHFWIGSKPDVNAQEVETAIERFIETGARISITELDIPFAANNNYHLDEASQKEQAELYGTLFEIYKKHADNIDRVTFWGKADIQSWRGSGMPLLFDNSYRPKAAFWTVIGLDAPISAISPETVTFYTNAQADAKVNITLNSNTLSAIRKGNVLLVEDKDYSVANASADGTLVVTIKKSYLATLSNNDVLTFEFSAGSSADLKITVTHRTSTYPLPTDEPEDTTDSGSEENAGSTEQTPTPEKPLLNRKLVDAEQVKTAVQRALQENEPVNFSDVPATHWSAKAVQLASQLGIVKGDPNGEFKGSANVTRAEFAEMIVRALGIDTTGENGSFSDTNGHWADASIRALHRAGIVNGTGKGAFKPDQEITRAEMAAILARILDMSAANETKFSDISGYWAADYINQLSQAGIVNGVGDGKFAPKSTATRDQSVAIIIRMLNIVLDLGLEL